MRRWPAWIVLVLLFGACGGEPAATTGTTAALLTTTALPVTSTTTAASSSTTAPSTTTAPPPERVEDVEIPAPSLAGSLVGEPTTRIIRVYLPPSYASGERAYPVVLYLPGFSSGDMYRVRLPNDIDAPIEAGRIAELILVVVDGRGVLGGSFYVDSPVTGNWEQYLVDDVVGYVEAHYRTLGRPESWGICGHSMGGFGAWNLAMRHPEVFGAVYALSPGLFDRDGLAESQMFAEARTVEGMLAFRGRLSGLGPGEVLAELRSAPDRFTVAYGVAFAPNPADPLLFDYPLAAADGEFERDEAVWGRWESGFGGLAAEVPEYAGNLRRLSGIVVDYGRWDEYRWIPKGCAYLDELLTAEGIAHQVVAYDGYHSGSLGERIREHVLPFFSTVLAAG